MIKKIDLILLGSILFCISTSLKANHYLIDVLLNAAVFPMSAFVLIYMTWLHKLHGIFNKKLIISTLLFGGTSIFLSISLLCIVYGLLLAIFISYSLKKSDKLEFVDIDIYSLPILISKNRGFFNVRLIVIVTFIYYCILFYLYSICHCLKIIPEFW